jgi:hypothetical protein
MKNKTIINFYFLRLKKRKKKKQKKEGKTHIYVEKIGIIKINKLRYKI